MSIVLMTLDLLSETPAMPMVKWRLEPTVISRIQSQNVQSRKEPAVSLTDVTNFIFVNVIRQLSCLCQQSKEMFEELEQMADNTFRRSRNLTDRVTVLKEMASRLNPTVDEGRARSNNYQ